ncbi:hypothetical protein BU15DRAFT_68135 [Melanogaster broomeanus]|nr:hypothetical protein BU15DRAFT_68135 [Melanogaster broomeanus]
MFPANTRYGANDIPDMAVLVTGIGQETKRRCGDQGIVSTSSHPGGIRTKLSRYARSLTTAKTFRPWARIRKPRADTASSAGKELWTWLEERVVNFDGRVDGRAPALHMTGQQIMKEVDGLQPHQCYMLGSKDELLMS